jgi:hypothetical protein
MAVTNSTFAATSSDGVTWTTIAIPHANWRALAYGNGLYIAIGTSPSISTIINPA